MITQLKLSIILAALIAASCITSQSVSAGPTEGLMKTVLGGKLYASGNYGAAKQAFESAASEFSIPGFEPSLASSIMSIADCMTALGQYKEGEQKYREALQIYGKLNDKSSQGYFATINSLAHVLNNEGKYDEAEPLYQQVLVNAQKTGGSGVIFAMVALAGLHQDKGDYALAEKEYLRAMDISRAVSGADGDTTAVVANNLASLYRDSDRYKEAEALYKESLVMAEKRFGKKHDVYAKCLGSLGQVYERQGRYDDAIPLLMESLTIKAQVLGVDHPDVADGWMKLAELVIDLNDMPKAKQALDSAYNIRKSRLGITHPKYTETVEMLGVVSLKQNNLTDAEAKFREVTGTRESTLGVAHPLVAKSRMFLGDTLVKQSRLADAEKLYKQALESDTKTFGKDHPRVAADLDKLTAVYKALNKSSEAQTSAAQAIAVKVKLPGGARLKTAPAQPFTTAPNAVDRPVGDKWALVIGVSNYQDASMNLRYSSKDARDFHQYLVTEGRFKPDHVKLVVDSDATRENILSLLGDSWLPRAVKKDDLVVLYVSSHGSPSEMDVRGENYIVVHDTKKDKLYATGISMQELISMIKSRIASDRILLVLDACHSGAAKEGAKGLYRAQNFEAANLVQGTGQLILCSSAPDQVSWESKNYPNGVFTRQLIEALRQRQGNVTVGEAYATMKERVQDEVLRDRGQVQTPLVKNAWQGKDIQLNVAPSQ